MSFFDDEPIPANEDTYVVEGAAAVASSGKNIKIKAPEFDEQYWIPETALAAGSEVKVEGDTGDLVVYSWLAERLGWV